MFVFEGGHEKRGQKGFNKSLWVIFYKSRDGGKEKKEIGIQLNQISSSVNKLMLDDCVFIVSTSSLACTNLFILWCIKQLNFVHNIHTRTGHTVIHQSSQNFFFVVSSTIRKSENRKISFCTHV